jgi:hypothetical protein
VEADGGTLFLDEIGELPPSAQVKLLRAVQDGEIDPVGGRATVKVDIRLISATHRDLLQLVKDGFSARTSITGSTSFPSTCRLYACVATTSPCWPIISATCPQAGGQENRRHQPRSHGTAAGP